MSSSQSDQGRPTRLPWIALAVISAVAVVVVFAYFGAEKAEQARRQERREERREARAEQRAARIPESGTACEAIANARKALRKGNEKVLRAVMREARQHAVEALNTTGIKFGKPERMALLLTEVDDLDSPASREQIERRLDVAGESCGKLES